MQLRIAAEARLQASNKGKRSSSNSELRKYVKTSFCSQPVSTSRPQTAVRAAHILCAFSTFPQVYIPEKAEYVRDAILPATNEPIF